MPESHAGRLLDHVHLRVRDLEASKRFYRAAVEAVGLVLTGDGDGWFSADELFVSDDGPPTERVHIAFQAADRDTVARFHQAAVAAGGTDNGGPGERWYHPGYYAAYVLDPDGNTIEAVYHGPASARRRQSSFAGEWQTASTLFPSGSWTKAP
jgi:catechol 2,3-dioxygenase-like lactoylglutathione lyase family enzyme